ncbi:larval cuticle protein LCP-17 [Manduca sexta]|uniref:Uncharacterized protein n=1 Tax=Manduca sexta TaxID=7130 RepID=A0A922CCK0_MANSE|nr:larval cuticle protein LCP-17 [Manduca sexta]KAG6440628.1 hypothetical protein O3G_MSEX001415 [Manduca sexta]KAG6440629.1 hypothetical protein O3G_MSEX001415 [Manduca sexta]
MKFFVVIAAVAVTSAAAADEKSAQVVRSSFDSQPEGSFKYGYETENGILLSAEGVLKNANSEYPAVAIEGGYKYTAPDGTPIEITYVADENGYRPQGNFLPISPPIPEAIARSLAWIAAHPPPVEKYSSRN